MQVVARQGDTLDLLCWRALGATGAVTEAALERNPGLADLGPVLPAGTVVNLPDALPAAARTRETVNLWS